MAHQDLPRPALGELDWSESQRTESLSAIYKRSVDYATGAENWYARKRTAKRHAGRFLRVWAILLTGAAAVVPILAELFTTDGKPDVPPAWAAVALALAATLVALDRFFGFTSAWARFMQAELQITRLRHAFEYAWEEKSVGLADPPSAAQTRGLIGLVRQFVLDVDEVTAQETAAWIREFRSILSQAEQELAAGRNS